MEMPICGGPFCWYFGVFCAVSHSGKEVVWALRGWITYGGVAAAGGEDDNMFFRFTASWVGCFNWSRFDVNLFGVARKCFLCIRFDF